MPFKLYPNPASNRLLIDVAPKQTGNFAIFVYDPEGKMIQQQSASSFTKNNHILQNINISKLSAGLYQVRILMPDKTSVSGEFIKE